MLEEPHTFCTLALVCLNL